MATWKLIEKEEIGGEWNRLLLSTPNASPFQTFEWGEFHRALGWKPIHLGLFAEDGSIKSAALVLLREFPLKTGFAWCVGGPSGSEGLNNSLPDAVLKFGGVKRLFFRLRCDKSIDVKDSLMLAAEGWTRSIHPIGSNFSMLLDLSMEEAKLKAAMSGKWRSNLRKSKENGLEITRIFDPDIPELVEAFAEMEKAKGIGQLFSKDKLEELFRHNRSNLVFLICRDENQNLLSARGALISGDSACDYIATTTQLGRKTRASFLTMWELLLHCKSLGVTTYDIGGIDPVGNPGVYRFKQATGARPVEFLGEWDWGSSNLLRYVGNFLLVRRMAVAQRSSDDDVRKRFGWTNLYSAAARLFNL